MKDVIGKTVGDILSGKLADAWFYLSPRDKAACIVGGLAAAAQFAILLVYGREANE